MSERSRFIDNAINRKVRWYSKIQNGFVGDGSLYEIVEGPQLVDLWAQDLTLEDVIYLTRTRGDLFRWVDFECSLESREGDWMVLCPFQTFQPVEMLYRRFRYIYTNVSLDDGSFYHALYLMNKGKKVTSPMLSSCECLEENDGKIVINDFIAGEQRTFPLDWDICRCTCWEEADAKSMNKK